MNELTIHPNVYSTSRSTGLISLLERAWIRDQKLGNGTFYLVSAFANYNGGVRFFPVFRRHVELGGRVVAIFGGSTRQNLTSKQVVQELLKCGADVHVINRKRLMHVKSYGARTPEGERLIITSGNFTGPGMAQNVEMSVLLDDTTIRDLGFSWDSMMENLLMQRWDRYQPALDDTEAPAWRLLYDEAATRVVLDETDEVTLIVRLGHADTVRINAAPGTSEARGTQYFWLSRDCYDFFPALTEPNRRGIKRTYSCLIRMNFVDLRQERKVRVTFEAENNLDFRLGTGPLKATGMAKPGDLAAVSRVAENRYELRLFRQRSKAARLLAPHAVSFIGHQGKKYGFVSNQKFHETLSRV